MKFIDSILRGIGQVIFQNNIFSGLLFIIGIFYNSWLMGLAALVGTVISTVTAQYLKYSEDDIKNGLYGFNGTLTGIAVLCFFELNLITATALVLGSVLSTLVMNFLKKRIPPFTSPFVIITWLLIYTLLLVFQYPLISYSPISDTTFNFVAAVSNSFGQVMFQENIITGLFFLLAISVNNKLMAAYAIYAAVLGSLTALILSESATSINAGLMGYNAILCSIALFGKK
ncbi:urea transporter [Aequorivita xiaoshiensis]|uniref:Urea transporter n=1 Tax=Aequorivita xiaoshiensis TaxID=2874476 RepID=A0A9X1U428_9FLAO|nr:urea transporter [Aequorivita xiaoshiensis]MCG2430410.1 urea transporter [Aequorivita xiaoshiensis]